MTNYKKLGEKIRKFRKEKGLTQEKLAESAKVDPKSVVDIENGKRNPTFKTINKMAHALGIALDELMKLN